MKKGKTAFLSTALVVLGGAGLIFGNQILASVVLASDVQTEPAIVITEREASKQTPLKIRDKEDDSTPMVFVTVNGTPVATKLDNLKVTLNGNSVATKLDNLQVTLPALQVILPADEPDSKNSTNGNLSEEDAKQMGINAIAQEYGLTQNDVDNFDVAVNARYSYTAEGPSAVPNDIFWTITLTSSNKEDNPLNMRYRAIIDDKAKNVIDVYGRSDSREGTPLEGEIPSDKAEETAIAALVKKYALTQETLDKFTVTTIYYEISDDVPGKHVWWVNLYPTDIEKFSEIGCYTAYINAETGEVSLLNSAADGKG